MFENPGPGVPSVAPFYWATKKLLWKKLKSINNIWKWLFMAIFIIIIDTEKWENKINLINFLSCWSYNFPITLVSVNVLQNI